MGLLKTPCGPHDTLRDRCDRDHTMPYSIYLEHLPAVDAAIQRGKAIKTLNRDKVGEDVLFAYDEVRRMLAMCFPTKVSPTSLCSLSRWVT
jgi:hypothetical protein